MGFAYGLFLAAATAAAHGVLLIAWRWLFILRPPVPDQPEVWIRTFVFWGTVVGMVCVVTAFSWGLACGFAAPVDKNYRPMRLAWALLFLPALVPSAIGFVVTGFEPLAGIAYLLSAGGVYYLASRLLTPAVWRYIIPPRL
ncbi:hypothetical protein HN937_27510 [Candidatus Poribacteria bacterium]|nr:hypothetical protein [Candidatus Poribacteria bacterium]